MDKQARGELLRQRFKATGGQPQPRKVAPAKQPEPSRAPFIGSWWGFSINPRVKHWLTQPDEAKTTTLKPKRTARPSPFVKDGPKRLVRAYQTAEAFAASRKPR